MTRGEIQIGTSAFIAAPGRSCLVPSAEGSRLPDDHIELVDDTGEI